MNSFLLVTQAVNISGILTAVQTVGFPIICCVGLGYYVKYITDKNKEEIDQINKLHREEMQSLAEALNNNTIAITRLCEKMESGEVTLNEKNPAN